MGIPPKKDKEPEPEEKDDEEKLLAVEDEEKKKEKDPEIVEKMINPSKAFSKEAIAKARGVGVARVLGTYGGPGEGTVFDVIQSTENNLGELFAAGMTRVVDAEGNEVSTFVPGGEGISALGAAVGTKGFDVSADGPEVAGLDKKERKISLKSSGAEVDGDADKKAVQATIRNRMGALQSCYEKALRGNTGLSGKIVYTITISVMGTVTSVQVLDDSLQDEGRQELHGGQDQGVAIPHHPRRRGIFGRDLFCGIFGAMTPPPTKSLVAWSLQRRPRHVWRCPTPPLPRQRPVPRDRWLREAAYERSGGRSGRSRRDPDRRPRAPMRRGRGDPARAGDERVPGPLGARAWHG
jgi:hypothetical protein